MTALKEEENQEDEREYEEAWKKIKEAWNSKMGEGAKKKNRPMKPGDNLSEDGTEFSLSTDLKGAKKKSMPMKPGDNLSEEGTEFSLSTILRDLRAMWTISVHTACTRDKSNVTGCQRDKNTKENPINPSIDKSLETNHAERPERKEVDDKEAVRLGAACVWSKSENLKNKEEIAVAADEETDIIEDRNRAEGEDNCEKTVPRKAYCFNCGEETEKSKKCRGCRKAR